MRIEIRNMCCSYVSEMPVGLVFFFFAVVFVCHMQCRAEGRFVLLFFSFRHTFLLTRFSVQPLLLVVVHVSSLN